MFEYGGIKRTLISTQRDTAREGVFMGCIDSTTKHFKVYCPELGYDTVGLLLTKLSKEDQLTSDYEERLAQMGQPTVRNDIIKPTGVKVVRFDDEHNRAPDKDTETSREKYKDADSPSDDTESKEDSAPTDKQDDPIPDLDPIMANELEGLMTPLTTTQTNP
jgi:hypothetical protein